MSTVEEPQAAPAAADAPATWRRFATLPAWLTAIDDPERVRRALLQAVPEFASGTLTLLDCDVHRVRMKDARWTAQYRLTVTGPGDDSRREVTLRGTLIAPGAPEPAPAADGAPFGAAGWQGWLPEVRLRLEPQPADAGLPALPHLTDPEEARVLLETSIRAAAPAYRDLRLQAVTPRVMRYNPGSRCTILYRLDYPPELAAGHDWPDIVVAKTYHRDKGRHAYAAMQALWESPLATGAVVTIAEPLGFLPEWNVLVQGPIREEQTLQDLIRTALRTGAADTQAELDGYLRQTAAGLAALHGSGVQARKSRAWEDERDEVREIAEELESAVPELAGATGPLLARLEARAATAPADPPGPAHGTFRPAQVLLNHGRIGFIDFDSFCEAEPALDVALFLEKIRDLGLSAAGGGDDDEEPLDPALYPARLAQVERLCATFLDAYTAHRPISRERVALWETLYLLTLVLHCWTKVKPARLVHSMVLLDYHLRAHDLAAGAPVAQ
jgi:hypothetical protein